MNLIREIKKSLVVFSALFVISNANAAETMNYCPPVFPGDSSYKFYFAQQGDNDYTHPDNPYYILCYYQESAYTGEPPQKQLVFDASKAIHSRGSDGWGRAANFCPKVDPIEFIDPSACPFGPAPSPTAGTLLNSFP